MNTHLTHKRFCDSLFKVILKAHQRLNSAALIRAACMRSFYFDSMK